MDAAQALADLVEISSQIEAAVLADASGTVLASTLAEGDRGAAIAADAAELAKGAAGPAGEPVQIQAELSDGSVFVVRDEERAVVAVTGRDPTVGLVFYDLKTCLRLAGEDELETKEAAGTRRKKKKDEAESGEAAGGGA